MTTMMMMMMQEMKEKEKDELIGSKNRENSVVGPQEQQTNKYEKLSCYLTLHN